MIVSARRAVQRPKLEAGVLISMITLCINMYSAISYMFWWVSGTTQCWARYLDVCTLCTFVAVDIIFNLSNVV